MLDKKYLYRAWKEITLQLGKCSYWLEHKTDNILIVSMHTLPAGWGIMLTSSMIPIVNTVSTSLFPSSML